MRYDTNQDLYRDHVFESGRQEGDDDWRVGEESQWIPGRECRQDCCQGHQIFHPKSQSASDSQPQRAALGGDSNIWKKVT